MFLVSLSDVQLPLVYKSHILNGPINKLYIFRKEAGSINLLEQSHLSGLIWLIPKCFTGIAHIHLAVTAGEKIRWRRTGFDSC